MEAIGGEDALLHVFKTDFFLLVSVLEGAILVQRLPKRYLV